MKLQNLHKSLEGCATLGAALKILVNHEHSKCGNDSSFGTQNPLLARLIQVKEGRARGALNYFFQWILT